MSSCECGLGLKIGNRARAGTVVGTEAEQGLGLGLKINFPVHNESTHSLVQNSIVHPCIV